PVQCRRPTLGSARKSAASETPSLAPSFLGVSPRVARGPVAPFPSLSVLPRRGSRPGSSAHGLRTRQPSALTVAGKPDFPQAPDCSRLLVGEAFRPVASA